MQSGGLLTRHIRRRQIVVAADAFTRADSTTDPGSTELAGKLWVPGFGLQGVYGSDGNGFLYLPGVTGVYASTPDSAALSITGDIDIRAKVALDDWTPGALNVLVTKLLGTGNQRSYEFAVNTSGTLFFQWSADGINNLNVSSSVAPTVSDGAALWVRVTLQVNNGSAQRVIKFWTSSDGSSWTQLGSTTTTAGTTSIFDGTAALEVGGLGGGNSPLAGKVYRAQVRNNILDDGTGIQFDADFTKQAAAARSFTEDSSNAATVTINGATWGIASNKAAVQTSVARNHMVVETRRSEVDVICNIGTWVTGGGLVFRHQDPANFLALARSGTNKLIQKIAAGVASTLLTIADTQTGVTTVQLRGSQIVILNAGVEIGRINDTSYQSATKHGLLADANSTQRWDDFAVLAA